MEATNDLRKNQRKNRQDRRPMMKRLRIPLLTAGGVVLCAFVLIPMAFDTLDIGPEIVEVSKSMLHMPSPTPTA